MSHLLITPEFYFLDGPMNERGVRRNHGLYNDSLTLEAVKVYVTLLKNAGKEAAR